MKKTAAVIVAILLVGAAACAVLISTTDSRMEELAASDPLDISVLQDGTYLGSSRVWPISVEVQVTVEGGRMTAIELLQHRHGQGDAAESIPATVLEAQSLEVDAVSGATYSSTVILAAIQDALTDAAR